MKSINFRTQARDNIDVSIMAALMLALIASAAPATGAAVARIQTTVVAAQAQECRPRGGLPNFFKKLEAGGEVRIAYLGGSITEAAGWRVLSREWFQKQYPQAKVVEIHAAISGTGAELGACRLKRDVLVPKPDLLFVEFAVNGAGATEKRITQTMEGIVRQTWAHDPATDICFVYTMGAGDVKALQAGRFSDKPSLYERVAEHYGIPSIALGMEVARLEKEGKLIFKGRAPQTEAEKAAMGGRILFTLDGTHPTLDQGHPLYLAAIVRSVPAIKAAGKVGPRALPAPLDAGNWATAKEVPLSRVTRSAGWSRLAEKVDKLTPNAGLRMAERWAADRAGETLEFRFRGTCFGLFGIKGPDAGRFRVTVDDRKPVEGVLFDGLCVAGRYRLWPWIYQDDLPPGVHHVKVELLAEGLDKMKLLKKSGGAIGDPGQYAKNALYLGDVLLVGDLE